MGILAFRVDNLANWENENPLLEDGEMAIVRDAKQYRIGDGFHKFKELESFGHGMTAYEIAVLHGHFRGSIEDFASQFNQFSRYGEQQCGKFSNDGPGWNAFHFPEEFGEDVYVTATVEDKAAFVSIKNITKTGFHYCVYTAGGNTTAENIVINYNAVAVSSKNLAHSIAQIAGLNPFDFDNLEMLFTSNVTEVVENEQAFGIVKRSSMAAAKYICLLTHLDIYNYHNVASAAADSTAMNIIAASPAARGFVQSSTAAYDAIRLSSMATAKYVMGIVGQPPADFENVGDIFLNENALTCLVNDATAMAAIRRQQMALDTILNSSIAMVEVAKVEHAISSFFDDENALICLVSSATAMAAVADSATAMAAIRGHQAALDRVLNSSLAMTEVAKVSSAVSSFFSDANALHCLVINATAMAAVAGSATAMAAIMKNSEAREKFFGSSYSVGRGLATYANINNSTLIGLQSLSAVAASAVAMSAVASSPIAMAAILKSNTARTNTAVLTSLSGKYDVLISTLNNSTYFTVSLNKTLTDTSNTNKKTVTITSTNGIVLLSTYKMNNYGGSDDTEGTIKHKTAAVVSKTWRLGTGNSTTNLNTVGVGGMDITATGTYTGKITYGTYTYNEYIAK